MELLEAMRTCRAIRDYQDRDVPDDVLIECLEAATWAPSGSNAQPWRFLILRDEEIRRTLGEAYREGWEETAEVYGLERPDGEPTTGRERMAARMFRFVDGFEDIPVYVLFCTEPPEGLDRLTVGASVYPAIQNFLLAARARGLGSVMTMWYRNREERLRELCGIPDDWEPAALTPVGYPAGDHGPVSRRPVEEFVAFDRWNRTPAEDAT